VTDEAERTRWKIRGNRMVDANPRFPLAELPGLIATGQITGAATIIGAQHALLTAGQRAH
jgi:hypothetical protein